MPHSRKHLRRNRKLYIFPGGSDGKKHLPTTWETWVQSLSQEDLLEKEMATHSSILAWKIPWMEEPGRLQSMGLQRVDTTEQLHFTSEKYIFSGSFKNICPRTTILLLISSTYPLPLPHPKAFPGLSKTNQILVKIPDLVPQTSHSS